MPWKDTFNYKPGSYSGVDLENNYCRPNDSALNPSSTSITDIFCVTQDSTVLKENCKPISDHSPDLYASSNYCRNPLPYERSTIWCYTNTSGT